MSYHGGPCFVKLLLEEDFRETMRIPPAFMAAYEGEFADHHYWVLETPSTPNKKFSAQLKHYGRHIYLCGSGWLEFANCLNLSAGDLLLFRCVVTSRNDGRCLHSVFKVEVYDAGGLSKPKFMSPATRTKRDKPVERLSKSNYKSHPHQSKRSKSEGMADTTTYRSEQEQELEFTVTLLEYHWTRLVFPAEFVKKAGLKGKEKVVLINPISGKEWEVEIQGSKYRFAVGKGWSSFRKNNKLRLRGRYKFTLVRDADDECKKLLFHRIS